MKTKIIASLVLGVFALMLFASAVSALTLSSSPSSLNFFKVGTPQTVIITNTDTDGNFNLTVTSPLTLTLTDASGKTATLIITPPVNLTNISSAQFSINLSNIMSGFSTLVKDYSTNLSLSAVNTTNTTVSDTLDIPLTFTKTFCQTGSSSANLELKRFDVSNTGAGEDAEWLPLDNVEVEVKFKNTGTIDLDNIIFELGLFNEARQNVADDLVWTSKDAEQVDAGDVDSGDDVSFIFKFKINPADLDSGKYKLMVKAYPEGDEDTSCIDFISSSYYTDVEVSEETDSEKMVIVDVDSLTQPVESLCGEEVTLTVDIYNVGTKDFPDQIKVTLVNKELGLNLEQVVEGDLDKGDKTEVTFTFTVPKGAEEKIYKLAMRTYYDYDSDDEDYDEVSDKEFLVSLKTAGACVFDPKLTVSNDKTSSLTTGQESVIKVTITNTGSTTRTFTVGVSGSDSWAKLVKFSPETLTLEAGKSGEVELTFLVNSDATGTKTFSLDLTEGKKIINQPVEVVVEKAGFSLFPGTGAIIGNKNWYVWAIGALNIVLVLIIILVAVRLVKK
jgi:hypothetical protein